MYLNKKSIVFAVDFFVLSFGIVFLCNYDNSYFFKQGTIFFKIISSYPFSIIYYKDKIHLKSVINDYIHGTEIKTEKSVSEEWKKLESGYGIRLLKHSFADTFNAPPFVYSPCNHSNQLLSEFRIDTIFDCSDEFKAIYDLSSWVGGLWDHGIDTLPGKNPKKIPPADLINAGMQKKRYWCEIAAIMTVKTFSALCWPSRLVSLSEDGYHMGHSVSEVWSNKHRKWVIVDADFNLLYADDSIPLSAFELCHSFGKDSNDVPRVIFLEKQKPSLSFLNLIFYYNYVSLDLRNDWEYRHLKPGSPVGGSLSSWWTRRNGRLKYIWPGKRYDSINLFNWQINGIQFFPGQVYKKNEEFMLRINLISYSPYFKTYQISIDGDDWCNSDSVINWKIQEGRHVFRSRVITNGPFPGPIDSCVLQIQNKFSTIQEIQ